MNVSVADYLEMEKVSEVKHEFIYGNVIEMAGTSYLHSRITKKVSRLFDDLLLDKGYESASEMRVVPEKDGVFFYPDIAVIKPALQQDRSLYIHQPILIAEVLSPSTRTYDSIDKFIQYKKLDSLQYYLLIDTEKQLVIFYERTEENEWPSAFFTDSTETIHLPLLGISISLKDIYPQ
jgi:Uma2 family endonuclease